MALKQFIYQKNKLVIVMNNKKDEQLINSLYEKLKNYQKEGLTITKKEVEDFFYLLIKNKESKDKICSWKSMPANNNCDIEKDKGCKIIKPDNYGTETIYLLEK